MTKNVKILGTTYNGVDTLNAKEADSEGVVKFVETSDANAGAEDIKRDKTAYVNGQKVVGTSDAIVPEGTLSVNVHKSHQIANVTNYENVDMNLTDINDTEIGRGVYEGVYTSDSNIGLNPMSDGVYKISISGADRLSQGVYQIDSYDATSLYSGSLTNGEWYSYNNDSLYPTSKPGAAGAYQVSYTAYGSAEFNNIATYPTTDGTYTYTKSTDSFVAGGGEPVDAGVYVVTNEGKYYQQDITEKGIYPFVEDAGSGYPGFYSSLSDGHYRISEGEANAVATYPQADGNYTYTKSTDSFEEVDVPVVEDDTYYYGSGNNLEYASGLHIINPENGKAEDLPATGVLRFGSAGWNDYEIMGTGYYRIVEGNVTDYLDPGVYVLAENGPQTLSGTYYINSGTAIELGGGCYSIEAGSSQPILLTNSLIAFYDQGQTTDLTDMDVNTEQTVTLVTGKQFKVTRIQ